MYVIRPRRDLRSGTRNFIYRIINNGDLPDCHLNYPGIRVDELDLGVLLDEIAFHAKKKPHLFQKIK